MKITLAKPITGPNGLITEVEMAMPSDVNALHTPPPDVDYGVYKVALYAKLPIELAALLGEEDSEVLGAIADCLAEAWCAVTKIRIRYWNLPGTAR